MVHRRVHVGLRQLRVVVDNIKPLTFPILVGVDELVLEVLLVNAFTHLDTCSTDYVREILVGLRLHLEEFPEQCLAGLDPQ